MICPKCKTKGKLKEKYCGKCGTKLQFVWPKLSAKVKWAVGSFVGVLLVAVALICIGDYFTSPAYIAKKYFASVIHNDIHEIYESMGVTDSTFVSEQLLQEKLEVFENVDTYKVVKVEENGREARVLFEYYLENDAKTYQAYVELYRNHAKKWLIYPKWKVNSASLAENIVFEVPAGSTVTVDDLALDDFQNVEQSTTSYDVYQVSKMIAGTYQVKVTLPIGTVVEKKVTIEDAKRFTVGDFTLSSENQNAIESAALQMLQVLYDGAVQNQTFDAIQENLPAMKSSAQIGKRYRTLKSSLQNQTVSLTKVSVASVEVISAYYNRNGEFTTTIEMIHHDTYTYEQNGEVLTGEKNDRTSRLTMIWSDTLQLIDLEWK